MTKKRWMLAAIMAIVAAAVAACAVVAPSKPGDNLDAGGSGPTALHGSWTLTWWSDAAELPDAPVTLLIEEGRVSGNSGCNQYSGSLESDASTLTVGVLATTLMSCGDALDQAETTYQFLLTAVNGWAISDGALYLSTDGARSLSFEAAS